jgi:OPA family hexose phosphate transport protein UhpT-like MFS transporter
MGKSMNLLQRIRKPTLDLPPSVRRKMWIKPFLRSYFVVLFAYAAMYIIRKNFNISQNELIQHYGFTKTNLGVIGFWFSITYGIGKTVVSYYGDGKNTKNYVALLLILSSAAMFGFGLGAGSLTTMAIFFALNGFFQSAGGPSSYATINRWAPRKFRGTAIGFWNISHNVGGALAAVIAVFGSEVIFGGDIRGMFLFPAMIACAIGVLGLFIGGDSPEAYGLGKSEEIFEEKASLEDDEVEKGTMTKWQVFVKYVLKNPFILALCFANVFVYIVRIGIDQWAVVYSKEVLGFSNEVARKGFTYFELGAILSVSWGMLSDFVRGRRALTSILSLLFLLFLVPVY